MKKSILLIAAVAMALSACSDNEKINGSDEMEIGFNNALIGKQTRNAGEMTTATLATDGNTMEVWGWKTYNGTETQVFNAQEVVYNEDSEQSTTNWEYTPIKYWDKAASKYAFYAVAPNSTQWDISAAKKISLTLTSTELVQILEDKNGASAVASGDAEAIDYLVATKVEGAPVTLAANDVAFAFNHILSKFEVFVKTAEEFDKTTYPNIELTKLSVQLEGMLPNYDQGTEGIVSASGDAWSGTAMEAKSITCFDADGTKITDLKLTKTAQSLAKYLVAPTKKGDSFKDKYTVSVEYTINYSASEREKFVSNDNKLANLTKFEQDTYNTLTVTVGPTAIYFDVESVGGWSNGEDATIKVE